ncbi:MAG: hypothetical protein FJ057_10570 [Cyanobacteria bacterium K_DeepCast_0m_m1_088]|nr:hypothetical protein [Cyanobacteria bacterium K_DeepCast_0m_m1_088]
MAGLNTHVLKMVVLHLAGRLALLFNGPGHFFNAGMGTELISGLDQVGGAAPKTDQPGGFGALTPAVIALRAFRQAE